MLFQASLPWSNVKLFDKFFPRDETFNFKRLIT